MSKILKDPKGCTYYAHSMQDYGSSKEKRHLSFLNKKKKDVFNPSEHVVQAPGLKMPFFLDIVGMCDELIVGTREGLFVSKGTYEEIIHAQQLGMPVQIIQPRRVGFKLSDIKGAVVHDDNDWKFNYGRILMT